MRTLYLDCGMGAAGDMLTAALLELLPEPEAFVKTFAGLGIPGVEMKIEKTQKCGITGTHVHIYVNGEEEALEDVHEHGHDPLDDEHHHDHEHHHDDDHHHDHHDDDHHHDHDHHHDDDHHHDHDYHHHDDDHHHDHDHHHHDDDHHHHHHSHHSLHDVETIVNGLKIDADVKEDVLAVYRLIAEAESKAHGKEVTEIHFHEVGTMDAIADVTAVCMLMKEISPECVIASPVATGFGAVRCAHGIMPVPAPATAHLLQGIPAYAGRIEAELCTPTGAALLKHFVNRFEQMPVMATERIGYGMGKKDFDRANCVRAFLGETGDDRDTVYELSCNVDDMTGEEMGFATEHLLEAGAREVFTTPVFMKKNRPGILLRVLVSPEDRERMAREIFKYTTTIGIREVKTDRYVLERSVREQETAIGTIRKKEVSGYGVQRSKWEYEDIARAASGQGISIREIVRKLDNAES